MSDDLVKLLADNHACRDPIAGRWISEARQELKKQAARAEAAEAKVAKLRGALAEARPIVKNAADSLDASPWQRETRTGILERIDQALTETEEQSNG